MRSALSCSVADEIQDQESRRRNELGTLRNGILALRALNRQDAITASQLGQEIGVSRTSARRILDTLTRAGLVDKLSFDLQYRLAPAAADLSSGLSEEHVLSHVSTRILQAATSEIGWTLSLATIAGAHMVLQVSTQNEAAHAVTFSRFGEKMPIFSSAAGKLVLAYMSDDQRKALFARTAKASERGSNISPAEAANLRKIGYLSPTMPGSSEADLYVPVFMDHGVTGCLVMRYFVSAIPWVDLERRYVPMMKQLSTTISTEAKAVMRDGLPAWLAQNAEPARFIPTDLRWSPAAAKSA